MESGRSFAEELKWAIAPIAIAFERDQYPFLYPMNPEGYRREVCICGCYISHYPHPYGVYKLPLIGRWNMDHHRHNSYYLQRVIHPRRIGGVCGNRST